MNSTLSQTFQGLRAEVAGFENVYPFKFVQDVFETARKNTGSLN